MGRVEISLGSQYTVLIVVFSIRSYKSGLGLSFESLSVFISSVLVQFYNGLGHSSRTERAVRSEGSNASNQERSGQDRSKQRQSEERTKQISQQKNNQSRNKNIDAHT